MTIYVDSAAGGDNDGTSWTNAFTSFANAGVTGAAAGGEVWISSAHSEDPGAAVTYDFSSGTLANPVRVISVNKADNTLAIGAAIAQGTTGRKITIAGGVIMEGVSFTSTDDIVIGTTGMRQWFRSCTFVCATQESSNNIAINANSGVVEYDSCTFTHNANAGQVLATPDGSSGTAILRNCTINFPSGTATNGYNHGTRQRVEFLGCKFVGTCTTLLNLQSATASYNASLVLRGCELPTFTNLISANPGSPVEEVLVEGCVTGAISETPLTLTGRYVYYGAVTSVTSQYRTGGAEDGAQSTPYAWKMVSSANTVDQWCPLKTPPIVRWVSGASEITATVFIAGGGDLQTDEVWLEVEGPDSASTETSQWDTMTTRLATRGSAANVTADATSSWEGDGVTNLQKLSVTYTPAQDGPLFARVCLAKASTTLYVDPQIVIASGGQKEWCAGGVQICESLASGGHRNAFQPMNGGVS